MKEKDNKQTNNKEYKPIVSDKVFTIFLIICFLLALLLLFINFKHSIEIDRVEDQRNYYKNQMLNFCKLAKTNDLNTDSSLYPCDKWVIK